MKSNRWKCKIFNSDSCKIVDIKRMAFRLSPECAVTVTESKSEWEISYSQNRVPLAKTHVKHENGTSTQHLLPIAFDLALFEHAKSILFSFIDSFSVSWPFFWSFCFSLGCRLLDWVRLNLVFGFSVPHWIIDSSQHVAQPLSHKKRLFSTLLTCFNYSFRIY